MSGIKIILAGKPGQVGHITQSLEVDVFTFSGGEVQVRLPEVGNMFYSTAEIITNINSARTLMAVFLTADALRRKYLGIEIHLVCPYLPYARQDRVCFPGEALSLRVACDLINSQGFKTVEVWDVHSDVGLALLDRAVHRTADEFVRQLTPDLGDVVVVAPDRGAVKRASACAKALGCEMITADKVRDPKDGKITGTVVASGPVGDKNFLMVDDIADGGRTFIELAKALRPLTTGKIFLYVTHGIFSQDFHIFTGLIDHIFTANLFEPHVRNVPEMVTVI